MGHRAPSHSKQPCPGTRGSAWVDRNKPLLLVGTIMDEANTTLSQNEISNVGADKTSAIVLQAEGPGEFGPPTAKKQCLQPEPETAQQMPEGGAGSAGPSELPLAENPQKTEPPPPSVRARTTQKQGTIMDEANTTLSQNEISNVGADKTSAIVKVLQAEGPGEFGPPTAKKQCLQPEPETARQMPEGGAGSAGPSELPLAPCPENPQKIEPPPPSVRARTTQKQGQRVPAKAMPVEDRSTFPSFRFMSVKMKLGLCAANHPRVCLTPFQLATLAQIILDMILGPEGQRVKPRFYGMTMEGGYLMLVCGDHTTISWVKELPKKLILGNIRLKVVERSKENKMFVAVGYFPRSEGETIQRVLRFLEIQNDGLNCSQWRLLDRNKEKEAIRMTFAIDWDSVQIIKAKGPLLNFRFGAARFMLKTKRGVRFKEEMCENDDFEVLDSVPNGLPVLDPFINPFAQANSFDYDFAFDLPCGSQMQMYPEDLEGFEYSARVAAAVEKAKTALRNGLTSRERFLGGKRNRKKKKKKKKGKAGAAEGAS